MAIYKRGNIYWYKFRWNGELIRESTKQSNKQIARNMESAHRTTLANGLVGIREKRPAPTLADFLKGDFITFAETKHAAKPGTLRYRQGCDMLKKSGMGKVPIDEVTDQHAQQFAGEFARLSPSGINRGLRTLRRAMNLAYRWGKLEKPLKVSLAQHEVQRDRVLSEKELKEYLAKCPQPWRDCAILIADEGFRPGEVFALQWPHVLLDSRGGLIRILEGKSKAARRVLPMTPRVFQVLKTRYETAGKPTEGWIFPSASRSGHFNSDAAKEHHKKALEDSKVAAFPPYVLRHTALTRLGEAAGGDVFALARIAGHSTITITQRYVHPEAESIDRVFANLGVGTKLGTKIKIKSKNSRSQRADLATRATHLQLGS